ncbi:MAG: Lrp/AsnC family transcriptional regulator, partial [Gammaproteobacteria bacterium]|nr:Lrp/AsnC family transcriptional regulator [Gammaproteobacteria bacterium]
MTVKPLAMTETSEIDAIDRQIIAATQSGLPLSRNPYHDIARQLDLDVNDVLQRMQNMLDNGIIRRIGVIPNHYKLGYKSNGMSVWN